MKMEFNKKDYDINYMKTHKKQFKVDLNIAEYEELDTFLKQNDIPKITFVRNSFEKLKEEYKMKKYMVHYEDQKMKNELDELVPFEYYDVDTEMFDTLEDARNVIDKFESYIHKDNDNRYYKRIATIYLVEVDENGNLRDDVDWEQIYAK